MVPPSVSLGDVEIEWPVRFDFSGTMSPGGSPYSGGAISCRRARAESIAARIDWASRSTGRNKLRGTVTSSAASTSTAIRSDETGRDPTHIYFTGLLVPEGGQVSGGPQTASAPPPPPHGPSESGDSSAPASSGPTGGPSQPQQPPPPPPLGPADQPADSGGPSTGSQTRNPPPQVPRTPSFRSPPVGTSLRSTVSASLREVHYEGACVKMGQLFKVTGTEFGAPGSYELRLRTPGVRNPLPIQVRRWTYREIVVAVAPHPELKPDGRTPYELVLTDRRGSVQTQLRKPIMVCR